MGTDEAESLGSPSKQSDDHPSPIWPPQGFVLAEIELAFLDQLFHGGAKLGVIAAGDLEPPRHRLDGDGRVTRKTDKLEDSFAESTHRAPPGSVSRRPHGTATPPALPTRWGKGDKSNNATIPEANGIDRPLPFGIGLIPFS